MSGDYEISYVLVGLEGEWSDVIAHDCSNVIAHKWSNVIGHESRMSRMQFPTVCE